MSNFEKTFLEYYLKLGLGSLPKSDIDALVMHLLDQYGFDGSPPLATLSNQAISERLRAPLSRIKKLRYDAALKFGANVEEQAKTKLLIALSKASIEIKSKKISLIIEDSLAANWLQGQLKAHKKTYDGSFNKEIIEVDFKGLLEVLKICFEKSLTKKLEDEWSEVFNTEITERRLKKVSESVTNLCLNLASNTGPAVFMAVKSSIGF